MTNSSSGLYNSWMQGRNDTITKKSWNPSTFSCSKFFLFCQSSLGLNVFQFSLSVCLVSFINCEVPREGTLPPIMAVFLAPKETFSLVDGVVGPADCWTMSTLQTNVIFFLIKVIKVHVKKFKNYKYYKKQPYSNPPTQGLLYIRGFYFIWIWQDKKILKKLLNSWQRFSQCKRHQFLNTFLLLIFF